MGPVAGAVGQCAMCKTTLENNVSNGNIGIAAGINTGILYLFFAPYLAVAVIAYMWYRTTKSNEQHELPKGPVYR
ncbi:MAG: hypothetical protein JNK10_02615 [Cyclobacteriaceae bacterium]|nr:hypothetical protein [Cyclobacteriaceae bacterium]